MTITDVIPACFYHPIKVIFLDDSRDFLDALDLEFGTRINMLTLTCPDTTLQEIDNYCQDITPTIFTFENNVNVDTTSDRVIGVDVGNILNQIYDKKRFNNVSVLVVDYEMPDVNGIDFCKKIQERKIFKIMLTAEADKDTAIKAFNSGLIDKFILKTSEELYSEITKAVHELTQWYFRELSWNIISGHSASIKALFNNKLYQQLFADVVRQAQAVEYYLVDHSGSILFLDKDANPTWFMVRHVKDLSDQLDLLKGYDLPEQIMDSVAKKEKILFLLSEKEYKKPVEEWVKYLFESKKLDDNYYYSIIQGNITDSIDWNRVVSYSEYTVDANGRG
ncbi:response regulator [Legionella drancourtii]|uniref:Response regulatory domain-containing protein n=1 Tax=Legionella drancourtii LLAP12 TaxID=658187 RepID=G9ESM3_9GAMM|nr:response regulator [Legionella drancourtii]EHL29704.1 hypothetical protein LDG_8294 [Legionella drancourtii LLAP12]